MDDSEVAKQVQKKRFLIDAFLYTSSLTNGGDPDSALKHLVTVHFLQAVMLELIIKILYELNQKNKAPFTHNLSKIFDDLNKETKKYLTVKFDEARERRAQQFSNVGDIQFHTLNEVLANNEITVKNFKYDAMGVKSNSSVDGKFYQDIFSRINKMVDKLNV